MTDLATPRVLVIDDDQTMRETLEVMLKSKYRVVLAESGERGLELMRQAPADVVLLDLRLPGMHGLQVLTALKYEHDAEVIVISGIREIDMAITATRLGAYHYMTKDFDYDRLHKLVEGAVNQLARRRQPVA